MSDLTPESTPADCQAAVFVEANRPLELRRFSLPTLEAGEAIVRVECCTICGSDLHTLSGSRTEPAPSILGHEILGVVTAVSDPPLTDVAGQPLRPGDRVTWATPISCGHCDRCRRGWPQKCRSLAKYGHALAEGRAALSGGLAEFVLLRRGSAVVRVPEELPAEILCPANCATATVCAAYRLAGSLEDRRVLILGAGMLGLTAAALARSHNASLVAVCDASAPRLQRARQFGAAALVNWTPDLSDWKRELASHAGTDAFDVVVELSGAAEAVEAAIAVADVAGKVLLVGTVMKSRSVSFDPESIVRRCLSIHGIHNYAPQDLMAAVAFLTQFGPEYPFAELVEQTFTLNDINQAIALARETRPVRIAIRPE